MPADRAPEIPDFIAELEWRGLLKDCTDEDGLREHLSVRPRLAYCGFDPTADSLTIGNLVPIMCLRHFQRAGHKPIAVMGGGTGLIGDPSGKSAERQLKTKETVQRHIDFQRPIFEALLDFDVEDDRRPEIVNNIDWLESARYIDMLRDVGKHFRVNEMVKRDSVRDRLDREQGISYTEFSYMILQAYDFLRLYEDRGVTVQLGGSDQYGNIVSGCDLIRRATTEPGDEDKDEKAFGLTNRLVTKADGGKFGKTESGAIWLTDASGGREVGTSPYAYYQFWLNTTDADIPRFLRFFTEMTREEVEALEAAHAEAPGKREAQKRLAEEATWLLHGRDKLDRAIAASRALFSGDLADLSESELKEVLAEVPSSDHAKDRLGAGLDPVELLVETGLAKSKREAREFVASGSVSVNGRKLAEGDAVGSGDLLHGSMIAIRRGKKAWHLTRWG
ncbi:MAG: tyrosine--tRNA ligase [Planctomycetota bacterium]